MSIIDDEMHHNMANHKMSHQLMKDSMILIKMPAGL